MRFSLKSSRTRRIRKLPNRKIREKKRHRKNHPWSSMIATSSVASFRPMESDMAESNNLGRLLLFFSLARELSRSPILHLPPVHHKSAGNSEPEPGSRNYCECTCTCRSNLDVGGLGTGIMEDDREVLVPRTTN